MMSSRVSKNLIIAAITCLLMVGAAIGGQWYVISLHQTLEDQQQEIDDFKQRQLQLSTTIASAEQAVTDMTALRGAVISTSEVVTFISEFETKLRQLGVTVETESINNKADEKPSLITFTMTLEGTESAIEKALAHQFLDQYAHRVEEVAIAVSPEKMVYHLQFSVLQFSYDF